MCFCKLRALQVRVSIGCWIKRCNHAYTIATPTAGRSTAILTVLTNMCPKRNSSCCIYDFTASTLGTGKLGGPAKPTLCLKARH